MGIIVGVKTRVTMIAVAVAVAATVALAGCGSKTRASLTSDARRVGTEIANAASSATDNAA